MTNSYLCSSMEESYTWKLTGDYDIQVVSLIQVIMYATTLAELMSCTCEISGVRHDQVDP